MYRTVRQKYEYLVYHEGTVHVRYIRPKAEVSGLAGRMRLHMAVALIIITSIIIIMVHIYGRYGDENLYKSSPRSSCLRTARQTP